MPTQTPFDPVEGDGFITLYPFPTALHPAGRAHAPGDRSEFGAPARPAGAGPDDIRKTGR